MSRFAIDEKRLRRLHSQGLSWSVIAKRLGCSTMGALQAAERLGLCESPKDGQGSARTAASETVTRSAQ